MDEHIAVLKVCHKGILRNLNSAQEGVSGMTAGFIKLCIGLFLTQISETLYILAPTAMKMFLVNPVRNCV